MTKEWHVQALHRVSPSCEDPNFKFVAALVQMRCAGATHIGKVREVNEDHFLITKFDRGQEVLFTSLADGTVPRRFREWGYGLAVADGMGGPGSGEFASSLAISTLMQLVLHFGKWNLRINDRVAEEIKERAERFYKRVGEVVQAEGQIDPSRAGMGTTLTVAYSAGDELFITSVGDSRAYLYRNRRLLQLTDDQTYAQVLADAGQIPQSEVAFHPMRHLLTEAIGARGADINVQIRQFTLLDGDQLLLCSDGLTRMVDDDAIGETLALDEEPRQTCDRLIEQALNAGGLDNITVILAKYEIPQ